MGIERSRRGVLQINRHDEPRLPPFIHGFLHHRLERLAVGRHSQHAVIRLAARSQRRTRRRRVGNPVIRRIGRNQRHVLAAVERSRTIALLEHHHRHMGQPHAVADHVNHIPHRHLFRAGAFPGRQIGRDGQHRKSPSRPSKFSHFFDSV